MEAIDNHSNSGRDYAQDREELSWKYYRREYQDLTTEFKSKVCGWAGKPLQRRIGMMKRNAQELHDTQADYHERQREDAQRIERRVDLKRAFDHLIEKYGVSICDAAAGEITANEACLRIAGRRRADVLIDIRNANEDARELLRDYRDVLSLNFQKKVAA